MDTLDSAPTATQAFTRLFNLRAVAVVFYLCVAMAASRVLGWSEAMSAGEWASMGVVMTRQSLISGMSILLAAALAEAWLVRPRPGPEWLWGGLAVLLGAALGTAGRHVVATWGVVGASVPAGWLLSTTLLWALLGGLAYASFRVDQAERRTRHVLVEARYQRETMRAGQLEAQFSALNAQIEPHFLFNTLATVKRLYETSPERGRTMMRSLIDYLHAALPNMRRSRSTLGEELTLVRRYLAILQMRMGPRLAFSIDCAPTLHDTPLPPLVLPTLVENAIKHGLAPMPEGGRITIRAQVDAGAVVLDVIDNGRGLGHESLGGSGVGLANTRARLKALHGDQATLALQAAQPRGVRARVRLPLAASAVSLQGA